MAQENGHADTPDSRCSVAREGTHIIFVTCRSQFGDEAMTEPAKVADRTRFQSRAAMRCTDSQKISTR